MVREKLIYEICSKYYTANRPKIVELGFLVWVVVDLPTLTPLELHINTSHFSSGKKLLISCMQPSRTDIGQPTKPKFLNLNM